MKRIVRCDEWYPSVERDYNANKYILHIHNRTSDGAGIYAPHDGLEFNSEDEAKRFLLTNGYLKEIEI